MTTTELHRRFVVILGCALVSLLSAGGRAADKAGATTPDSIAVDYHLPEIVVTANRVATTVDASPASLTLLTSQDLATAPGLRLASSLAVLPGVFVRPYGGGGALQTVSFRGMSAEHTVLIVDDQRMNSVQNGQADFGILTRFNVERVEVVRGGNSALYGADAMGGVVRAFTRKPTARPRLHASVGAGSAGLFSREVSVSGTVGGVGLLAAVHSERGSGAYPYLHSEGGLTGRYQRLGADYDIIEGAGRLSWTVLPGLETELSYDAQDADRGIPGPVIRPDDPGGARLSDRSTRWSWIATWRPPEGVRARLVTSLETIGQQYVDPSLAVGGTPLTSVTELDVLRVSPEIEQDFSDAVGGVLGLEFQRAVIAATSIGREDREQLGAWYCLRITTGLGATVLHDIGVYPSVRFDRFSDFGEAWSPKLGLNVAPHRALPLRLRASISRNFRAPTFNELHWIPGGNPGLQPERSTAMDAGLIAALSLGGELSVDAGVFSAATDNRILWLPGPSALWSPRNVGRVETSGFELDIRWLGFDGAVAIDVNSTWTDARKASASYPGDPTAGNRIIYVPAQTLNAAVELRTGPAAVRAQHSWVSYRYTSEDNTDFLPAYGVASLTASVRFAVAGSMVTLSGEISNLLNESYEIMPNYPMPLRTVRGSLGVDL